MAEEKGMIDLGKTFSKEDCMAMDPCKDKSVHYPTLYVSGIDDVEIDALPEGEFTFTAKAKLLSSTESFRDGKRTYSCEIEIQSIKPEGGSRKKKSKSTEESLDEAFSETEKKKSESYSEDDED
jgi:hypothetical protein